MTDWNHNSAYHPELLRAASEHGGRALDVGCGDGLLMSKLAATTGSVVGIDADERAVSRAVRRLAGTSNTEVLLGDFLDADQLADRSFDIITCVATLHHMPLVPALDRMQALLNPGGRLIVIGLSANTNAGDWLIAGAQVVPVRVLSMLHRESTYEGMTTTRPRESLAEIRATAPHILPGCRVRRRFWYRYSLTWTKPTVG